MGSTYPRFYHVNTEEILRLFSDSYRLLVIRNRPGPFTSLVEVASSEMIGIGLRERVLNLLGQLDAMIRMGEGSTKFA
jgi:hypothetical protein